MAYKPNEFRKSKRNPRDKMREGADLDFGVYMGEVIVRPKDATHSGRITVYVPMLSKDRNDPAGYFHCYWSSPFAGTTPSAKIGENIADYQDTMKTYGMWMVPPDPGNFVLMCFADGKKKMPVIIGCMFPDQMQYMVPGNAAGPTYGANMNLPVAEKNKLDEDLDHGNKSQRPLNNIITESILNQGLIKDQIRGTTTASARRESPSQVFGILTPGPDNRNLKTGKNDGTNRRGGHSFVMDDNMEQRHIRLRSALGNQILLDDTNGLIYIINRDGTAWVELDEAGSVNVYSNENLNIRAKQDINIRADNNLNLEGGVNVNISAGVLEEGEGPDGSSGPYGDVKIQSGNAIENYTINRFKVFTKDPGSAIEHASKGQIRNFSESQMHILSQAEIFMSTNADMHVKSGGTMNQQAGGRNNIIGSTVHLNDGGSASQAEQASIVERIAPTIHTDVSDQNPEFEYEEGNVSEDTNPLPTDGDRPPPDPDTSNIASILPIVTTVEPWIGHGSGPAGSPDEVTKDGRASENNPTNAINPNDTSPANYVADNGQLQVGTGYDGVAGDNIKALGGKAGPGSVPDYIPSDLQSTMGDPSSMGDSFYKTDACSVGAGVLGSAVSNTAMPVELDNGRKLLGKGHILSPQEVSAGVTAFGGGTILNPKSGGLLPGTNVSVSDATNLIKGGVTQDLVNAGLSRVMGSKGTYQTGTGYIIHNLGMNMATGVATKLAKNTLGNTAKWVALSLSGAQGGMSRNQYLATVMFAESMGESNWMSSSVKSAILNGDYIRVPIEMMNYSSNKRGYKQNLENRRVYESTLWGMPDSYSPNHVEGSGTGWGNKAAQIQLDNYELTKKYGKSAPSFFPVNEDAQLPISKIDLADRTDKAKFYNPNDKILGGGRPGPILPFFNIFNI